MLTLGYRVKVASEMLGHPTVTITADTYQRVAQELRVDVAEKMGALLFGSPLLSPLRAVGVAGGAMPKAGNWLQLVPKAGVEPARELPPNGF